MAPTNLYASASCTDIKHGKGRGNRPLAFLFSSEIFMCLGKCLFLMKERGIVDLFHDFAARLMAFLHELYVQHIPWNRLYFIISVFSNCYFYNSYMMKDK